jgi:hypothetical protein
MIKKNISRNCPFPGIGRLEENLINGKEITALEGKKEKRGISNLYCMCSRIESTRIFTFLKYREHEPRNIFFFAPFFGRSQKVNLLPKSNISSKKFTQKIRDQKLSYTKNFSINFFFNCIIKDLYFYCCTEFLKTFLGQSKFALYADCYAQTMA